jgi:hypothetical protein
MKHTLQLLTILATLFYLSITQIGFAQTRPAIEWSRCYGGSRDENGGGGVNWKSLLPTSDGGYIIAAETSSIDGDIDISKRRDDMFPMDSFRNEDIWLIKISKNGEKEWEKYYGGSSTEYVTQMKPTSDGGYILCGFTNSIDGDLPFDTTGVINVFIKGGTLDGYVMKLDSLCNKEWVSRIGGTGYDHLYSIIETSDNGYLTTGVTYSTDETWLGYSWFKNNTPYPNGFIAKLDADGNKKWNKLYGGSMEDALFSSVETQNGFLICGVSVSADGDISAPHYVDTVNNLYPSGDCWIIETDKFGSILREKCFGGSKYDGGQTITAVKDGYVVTANTLSSDEEVIGYHPSQTGLDYAPYDTWIFKIDTNWNILWQNCIGGSQQDVVTTLIPNNEGGFCFIGATNSSDSMLTNIRPSAQVGEKQTDIWVGEISETGKLLWHGCYGGSHYDLGNGITKDADGGYTLFTSVGSNDGDISGNHGGSQGHNRDIWIAKLKKQQNGVEAYSGSSQFSTPYPNPSFDHVNLTIYPTQPIQTVQFFSPLGQEFYPKYQLSGNLLTTDTRTLAKGMYIIRITYQDLSVQEVRKFVKVD